VTNTVGIRYLGNRDPGHMEVHDLDQKTRNCQIDEILRAGHGVGFLPDTLEQAHKEGFDNCAWCLGGSTR
jgi:hypothetical protein